MLNEVKVAIDSKNWDDLKLAAGEEPVAFFSCITKRYLGVRRLQWLVTFCTAYDEGLSTGSYVDFHRLVLRAAVNVLQ